MSKIKITEEQAKMLKEMGKTKVLKITKEQYDKIVEVEGAISEKSLSPMGNRMAKQSNPLDRSQFKRELKSNLPEMYEKFINELYGVSESTERVYEKLHKLMEGAGLIANGKLVKEKFDGNKERVKQVINAGLYEMSCGGSAYKAMEAIEEALELKDITPGYFNKQIGEPKKSGKSREELISVIKSKREESKKETERQEALKALANREEEDKIESDNGVDEHNYKDGDYVGHSEPKNTKTIFDVLLKIDSDLALMKKNGELYVFQLHDESEFHDPDYVSVPGEAEHSEDGWNTIYNYEDIDIDERAIELYINDNFNRLDIGQGFNDYDSGEYDIIKLDDEIKSDLLSLKKYITPRKAKELENILTVGEATIAASAGPSTGPLSLGDEPKYKPEVKIVPEEVNNSKYEYGIYTIEGLRPVNINGEEIHIPFTYSNGKEIEKEDYIDLEGNVQDNFVKIIWDGDKEIGDKLSVYDADGWQYGEGSDGKEYSIGVSLSNVGGGDWDIVDHNHYTVEDSAISEATTMGGGAVPIFDIPMGRGSKDKSFWHPKGSKGPKMKGKKVNEDSQTETQWKGGSFVKVKDKCNKFPYCDQGAGAIELKKTKRAVISNDHIAEEVAKKTNRTVEDVKNIINNKNI